jgi:hypothetical protein
MRIGVDCQLWSRVNHSPGKNQRLAQMSFASRGQTSSLFSQSPRRNMAKDVAQAFFERILYSDGLVGRDLVW